MLTSKDVDYTMFPSMKQKLLALINESEKVVNSELAAEDKNARLAELLNSM